MLDTFSNFWKHPRTAAIVGQTKLPSQKSLSSIKIERLRWVICCAMGDGPADFGPAAKLYRHQYRHRIDDLDWLLAYCLV